MAVTHTSRICRMAKKYFFSQSSKYHRIRCWSVAEGWSRGWSRKYRIFRPGAPPPTHQSTTHLTALRPSSLPPFPRPRSAIPLSVSSAFVLCTGLAWTKRVSALSLSESVPLDNMVFKKCVSDALLPVKADEAWYAVVSASNSVVARFITDDICAEERVTGAFCGGGRGGAALYHCALGSNTNLLWFLFSVKPVGFGGCIGISSAGTPAFEAGLLFSFFFAAFSLG